MSDLFWADKPAGLTTHTSLNARKPWTDPCDGFAEWLGARVGPLFPVHRLDRDTTGVIVFARSSAAAARASAAFEAREVLKDYWFVTDRTSRESSFEVTSHIERRGNEFVSSPSKDGTPNSYTRFERVRAEGRFTLWRAFPETGKPHQIRLHAQEAGIPLLGDVIHGGTEFPALCLHAHSLTLDGRTHTAPPPVYFETLSLLNDERLVGWLAACDRRERALRSVHAEQPSEVTALPRLTSVENTDTIRWIHTEGDPLRVEELGDVVCLNWFRETYPNEREWVSIHELLKIKQWRTWYLQIRTDRGKDPITDLSLASEHPAPPERWTAHENDLKFEFRRETGLSPGLFLDQRRNRAWLKAEAQAKRVLNLFCYTGGFSVAAAAGGAEQVVSVDVSKPFLEWAKRNFELNGLELTKHEFRAIDSGEYLAWAAKKGLKFDFIVCDPPSFARTNTRGKSAVFKIENEFPDLLEKCLAVAAPKAQILFSTNFEKWTLDEFAEKAQTLIGARGRVTAPTSPDIDFELPRADRHMKALLIQL